MGVFEEQSSVQSPTSVNHLEDAEVPKTENGAAENLPDPSKMEEDTKTDDSHLNGQTDGDPDGGFNGTKMEQ